ncbi:efflux RND transporter permease subunit [Erythrobacter rubeus]|uniref:MMPL family transporter n=1 Tax=Erythrobacter rubeus TaxID=2760803 RepID=A0ABR8KKZ3_9SPHN|nr:MMPL family transporter [Erythrobacter rubeus]MBD2840999.1 MMPL family transporter [Erythrobacter rubeus]
MIGHLVGAICRQQRALLVLVLGLLVVSLAGASQIRVEDGARDIFVSSFDEYARFTQHTAEYPQSDSEIVVLVTSEQPFDREQLTLLQDLVFDGQLIDGVDFAHSIFSMQEYDTETESFQSVIEGDLSAYDDVSDALDEVADSPWTIVPMLNAERTETILVYAVEEQRVDDKQVQPIIDEFRELFAQVPPEAGLNFQLTGTLPILNTIVNRIIAEQGLLNGIGGLLGLITSLFLFRSLVVGLLTGIAPIFAVLLTLGAMGWLGLEMNVLTNSISILILVITMANCIHMTFELRKFARQGAGRNESIRGMMQAIASPCILTGLTTMIAMAGLSYSDSELIRVFSLAAVVGLCMSLFAAIVVHPLVFTLTWRISPIERALRRQVLPQKYWSELFGRTTQWLLRRKFTVLGVSVVAAAVLLAAFLPVQTTHRFNEYLHDDDPILLALERAEAISSPTQSLDIVLRQKEQGGALVSEPNLDVLASVHEDLEAAFPNNRIYSLHSLRRILRDAGQGASADDVAEMLEKLPERAQTELIGETGNGFKLSFRVADQPSPQIRELMDGINARLDQADLGALSAEPITGLTALAAVLSDKMIKELTISFLIAAFACPILIALWFGQWRFGLAAVLPNVIPVLVVGAWLMVSGWHLQFIGAIALSIAFGVAVDDTIHVLNRYDINRREKGRSFTFADVPAVMKHVAPALMTTTLVLSIGISSAFLSEMPTVIFFGGMCIAIFTLALLADLFILLPVLAVLERKRLASAAS